ncbi:MAG: hypothetical protein PVI94_23170 [Desulfobacterales bacterium]|jgi:hypothetical protein
MELEEWMKSYVQKFEIGSAYCTTCINMTPTVKAIMTPSIITLDAFWVSRITAAVIEIMAIAAIKDAGAITQGMFCANISRDCIWNTFLGLVLLFFFQFYT